MKSIIIFLFFILTGYDSYSQGCSDAGFCSIDGIKQNSYDDNELSLKDSINNPSIIKIGLSMGNTRYSVWILNHYFTYSYQINKRTNVSIKIDDQFRFGKLTNVFGFSDITFSLAHKLKNSFGVIGGIKIPLSSANRKHNGNDMPMAYQTSLGTYDAIAGFQYTIKNLFFVVGWQQPIIQNANSFKLGNFSEEELGAIYPETNQFRRSGDVLLRISYKQENQTKLKNFTFTYSLLPIYHYSNDLYTNAEDKTLEIKNSKGLTLNANIFSNYKIDEKSALEFSVGFPIIARKVRPEGLSQFATTIEYIKRF